MRINNISKVLMTLIGIQCGPVTLFGYNFLINLLISSVVASGNSGGFSYAQFFDFGYTWMVFIFIY